MSGQQSVKAQIAHRFEQPHFRLLRQIGLFEPLRQVNRWLYRLRRQRRALEGRGLVPEARLREVYRTCLTELRRLNGAEPIGDYLEFGVGFGSSMACMHEATVAAGACEVRMFGFDSFAGLPKAADEEEFHGWSSGQIQSSDAFARKLLTARGVDWRRTTLVKGWFDHTLTPATRTRLGLKRAGIIMIDSDLYASACQALAFCEPLIAERCFILFDEWGAYGLDEIEQGEKRAFSEFLARNPDLQATTVPSYRDGKAAAAFRLDRISPAR